MQLAVGINTILVNLVELAALGMLFLAVLISTSRTVSQMIPFYRGQCFFLGCVTLFTAIEINSLVIGLFTIIPLFLFLVIEPLLVQATVPEDVPYWKRLARSFIPSALDAAKKQAVPAWLLHRNMSGGRLSSLLYDLALFALAFVFAFSINPPNNPGVNAIILAVSFSLLLLGLQAMIVKEDMISQVMGLLVMEQGMFLAAIRLISIPEISMYLVLGLFFYTVITLTILVFLLPELHRASGSVEIDQQTQLKG